MCRPLYYPRWSPRPSSLSPCSFLQPQRPLIPPILLNTPLGARSWPLGLEMWLYPTWRTRLSQPNGHNLDQPIITPAKPCWTSLPMGALYHCCLWIIKAMYGMPIKQMLLSMGMLLSLRCDQGSLIIDLAWRHIVQDGDVGEPFEKNCVTRTLDGSLVLGVCDHTDGPAQLAQYWVRVNQYLLSWHQSLPSPTKSREGWHRLWATFSARVCRVAESYTFPFPHYSGRLSGKWHKGCCWWAIL